VRLSDIARACRQYGITSYDDGKIKLTFGPTQPVPAKPADEKTARDQRAQARPNLVDLALSDEAFS